MEGSTLFEWADRLKALRDRKEALEAELRQVNMDIDNADWHLSNLMAESETQKFHSCGHDVLPDDQDPRKTPRRAAKMNSLTRCGRKVMAT